MKFKLCLTVVEKKMCFFVCLVLIMLCLVSSCSLVDSPFSLDRISSSFCVIADTPECVPDNANILYGRLISLLRNSCRVNAAITCVLPEPFDYINISYISIFIEERNSL